ncbi:MAG: hypothetical protein WKF77_20235 [Planctomycetaceae bacterium]
MDPALRARMSSDDILQDAFDLARNRWPEFSARQKAGSSTNEVRDDNLCMKCVGVDRRSWCCD